MDTRPLLTFAIVLTRDGVADALECLSSLSRLDCRSCRTLVVDNGSSDSTMGIVRNEFPNVDVIQNGCNLGFSGGNNVGIEYALQHDADYIFLLNNDTAIESNALSQLLQTATNDPQIGILCPTVTSYFNGFKHYVGARIYWDKGVAVEVERSPDGLPLVIDTDYAPGCALLVRSEVVRKIGLLDPAYFAYYEDVDWSVRCKRAGYRVVAVPQARVYHKGTMDQQTRKPPGASFYLWRNRFLFMRRHAGLRHWPPFLKHYIRKSLELYQSLALAGDDESAEAVLDGCWAGMLGRYGSERLQAPARFKQFIRRRLGIALWLTGWLYFWDYHKLKRQEAKELRPSV